MVVVVVCSGSVRLIVKDTSKLSNGSGGSGTVRLVVHDTGGSGVPWWW